MDLIVCLVMLMMSIVVKGQALNRPSLCPSATWNANASTFLTHPNNSQPRIILVNKNNESFITEISNNHLQTWPYGSASPSKSIYIGIGTLQGLSITDNGDIYIGYSQPNPHVEKWTLNATSPITVLNVTNMCYGLFVTINHTLYCSVGVQHMVLEASLLDTSSDPTIVAGNGTSGSASNELNTPNGLYVDENLNLYVADCGNNRIQMFPSGQSNGVTRAGNGASGSIMLNCPTGVMLDANDYLFIVEYHGNRIIGSSPIGFRCLVGCWGSGNSASQLNGPYSFSFDTMGNFFVTDQWNARIQKFYIDMNVCGPSYNQPILSACATWDSNMITAADAGAVGTGPNQVFVDARNNVFVTNTAGNEVLIWLGGHTVPHRISPGMMFEPHGIFVTLNDDIYVDNGQFFGVVEKWSSQATIRTVAMYVNGSCFGLFVDTHDNIYCSLSDYHQVIKHKFNDDANITSIVAGDGTVGSGPNQLHSPHGIFVDENFSLYVADYYNHRIQRFDAGNLNGTTVAGDGAPGTIVLFYPTAVILDGRGYLFIAEETNARVIASAFNRFRCIIGCSSTLGNTSSTMIHPRSLSFDSTGNLLIADTLNHRIVKVHLTINSCNPSYNQPIFSPCATWNSDAVTFGNPSLIVANPYGMFVDIHNTLYVTDHSTGHVQVWFEGSATPTMDLSGDMVSPYGVFATNNGDIYVDNAFTYARVDKWSSNTTIRAIAMYTDGSCLDLFVDIYGDIYCSLSSFHRVIKRPLTGYANMTFIIAGNGTAGSTSNMLNNPRGIFVSKYLELYVADSSNNRIQRFLFGASYGITVAGDEAVGTITLSNPTSVVLDGSGNLFITDAHNRIIGSGPTGFRCIAACSGSSGNESSQLNAPQSLRFGSDGSLFVVDRANQRIQQFPLTTNSCDVSYNQPNLSSCATWNQKPVTFANGTIPASYRLYRIFIDTHDTIYATDSEYNSVYIWFAGSLVPDIRISGGMHNPMGIFVALNGDIYVDNGLSYGRVEKWSSNGTTRTTVLYVNQSCLSLFADIYGNIYCALESLHRVIKRSFNDNANTTVIVAGNGTNGAASDMLNNPRGIFVDVRLNLYVADYDNHRIQLFLPGQRNGTTVAGNGANGTIKLFHPIAIVLDVNGFLFISDTGNKRIVGSSSTGFRCIVGCWDSTGNGINYLNGPRGLAFDSDGNLFVTDGINTQIQKFFLATNSCAVSYNQPNVSSCSTWNPNAITVADQITIGSEPYGIFIDTNNTIYIPSREFDVVQIWLEGGITPIGNISDGLKRPFSTFITLNGDIYVDNGEDMNQVDKWTMGETNSTTVMYVNESCVSLFVDRNNDLYCSTDDSHKVVKRSLYDSINASSVIAGTGVPGLTPTQLNNPRGVFVDTKFNLYVADCTNDRIQFYQPGFRNGTTIVGNGANGTITINCPMGITLDADRYLFIVEYPTHRIVGSSINGFRCIVGCTGSNGSAANQLFHPRSLAFDSYGNLFVVDQGNNRIQKFLLSTNFCNETTTLATTDTTEFFTPSLESTSMIPTTHSTAISDSTIIQSSPTFYPSLTSISPNYNLFTDPCAMLNPCQNDGTCIYRNRTLFTYTCLCSSGFAGVQCQLNQRPCQTSTCLNNGLCSETSNTTFICSCQTGYQDSQCQSKTDYCTGVTCLNKGVCQSSFLNYTCLCLGDSYSGRHCEITKNQLVIYQTISRSFAYVAIIFICSVAIFIVILDVLKYGFGVHTVERTIRRKKPKKGIKKHLIAIRFTYVNAPSTQLQTDI